MSSRFLLSVFDSVYVVALTAWVGSVLFFTFGVSPIIFDVLGDQAGGRFVRALFPRYYLWGAIAGAIALPSFVARSLCYQEFRGPMVGVQAMVILAGILSMLYGGNSLTPAINQAREAGSPGQRRFEQLHRRAVGLNAFVLIVGLGLVIAFALRPAPGGSGLVELAPAEQVRYDAAVNRVIEEVEARHGMRPPRVRAPGESAERDPIIDDDAVKEIESLYEHKRLRDQARGIHR
jgi:MFS family permease